MAKKDDGSRKRKQPRKPDASDASRSENGTSADSGFLTNLFRPLSKHRVTLTRVGKSLAPMRRGKGPAKPTKKAAKPKAKAAKPSQKTAEPKTARDRQVSELKTLARIGKQDPERLAGIISRLLLEAEEEEEAARLKFERMVWERAERRARRGKRERDWEDDEGDRT